MSYASIQRSDFTMANAGSRAFNATRKLGYRTWKELDGTCACMFLREYSFGSTTLEALRKAAHEHGVTIIDHWDHTERKVPGIVPDRYMGVEILDQAVRRMWTSAEAEWWRRGVAAAVSQLRKERV